jgi:hypothetical protein
MTPPADSAPPAATGGDTGPADPPAGRAGAAPRPRRRGVRAAVLLVPAVVYLALALLRLAPAWRDPTRLAQCGCGDSAFSMWYLGWTPFALGNGLSPLSSDWMFFPDGLNAMWNVSLLLPAVLLAPVTAAGGVVLAYNVLVVIAFAGSAYTAYLVLRRWAPCPPAAFAGGLLYGFSPYMTGQGLGHLHMIIMLLVPVFLLLLDEILVRQRRPAWLSGSLLGVTAAAQLLTSEEVLAGAALIGLVGTVVLVALFPRDVRSRLRYALTAFGLAVGTGLLLAAIPLRHQFTGPQRLTGTVSSPDRYRADLLSWVVPNGLVEAAPDWALRISGRFIGNAAENGSYLGLPLLLVALATAGLLWRRRPVVRWAAVLLAAVLVLSSGPSLRIGGRETGIPLPLGLLEHVPLFDSVVSVRLSSYAVLLCALLLAIGMDAVRERVRAGGGPPRRRTALAAGLPAALAVVALLPLVPGEWRYQIEDTRVPAWYRSAAVTERVPLGSVLVTVPPASAVNAAPMVWQGVAGHRFKVPFGYSLHPDETGQGRFSPDPSTFAGIMERIRRGPPPRVNAGHIRAMRADLRRWQARTVVVTAETNANMVDQVDLLTRVLGRPPRTEAGAWVWYDIDPDRLAALPATPPVWRR